jgi:hypothetical protein
MDCYAAVEHGGLTGRRVCHARGEIDGPVTLLKKPRKLSSAAPLQKDGWNGCSANHMAAPVNLPHCDQTRRYCDDMALAHKCLASVTTIVKDSAAFC